MREAGPDRVGPEVVTRERGFDRALETLRVEPYPRALWLKRPPPAPFELPATSVESSQGIHVPCDALGTKPARVPLELGALFLLEPWLASRQAPSLRQISPGEAATRLSVASRSFETASFIFLSLPMKIHVGVVKGRRRVGL